MDSCLQDLETSEDLAQKLNALFPEDQIYRQALEALHLALVILQLVNSCRAALQLVVCLHFTCTSSSS